MSLNTMIKKIAIFGGCFDPIHNGHIEMAKATISQIDVEEVWFMPEFNPPHKDKNNILEFDYRYEMTKIATSDYDKFKCIDFEKELYTSKVLNITSTYKVLKELEKICKNKEFLLLIGYDSLFNLETWKDKNELLSEYEFIIASRLVSNEVNEIEQIEMLKNKYGFRYKILQFENVNISATKIRQAFRDGEDLDIINYLPSGVYNYIKDNNLYVK